MARRAFGTVNDALGKTIKLDDQSYSVIGVLPDAFRLDVLRTPDVFVPLTVSAALARDERNLVVIGRLRPNANRAQGLADLEAVARRIAEEHPDTNSNFSVLVENLRDAFIASANRTWLLLLLAFSLFVLLIACSNVATLQLMRAVVRQRQFAVREAFGASRGAMFRQAVAESAWLAGAGAVLGVLMAMGGLQALRAMPVTAMMTRESEISINVWSVIFVIVVSVFATFLFGLAPGFFSSKTDLESALRGSGRGTSSSPGIRRRIEFLSGAQVTLAFLSLFATGLFAISCRDLQLIPLGFNPQGISTLQISLSGVKYAEQKESRLFYTKVMEHALSLPGIREFALSSDLPLTGGTNLAFVRADRPRPSHGAEPSSLARITTPGYFHVFGIPILKGRAFSKTDTASSPRVALINLPASQAFPSHMYAVAKTNAPSVGPLLRKKIQGLDPEQFLTEPKLMETYVEERLQSPRFNFTLVGIFAALALLLTAVALMGTLSFTVAQQTRDIGLRIAVGARSADIVRMILRQTFRLIAAGSICGAGIAAVFGAIYRDRLYMVPHQHEGILYGVNIHDPLSFGLAVIVLFVFASLSALLPSLRAIRIDPNTALRSE